jgi:hypothetical protein
MELVCIVTLDGRTAQRPVGREVLEPGGKVHPVTVDAVKRPLWRGTGLGRGAMGRMRWNWIDLVNGRWRVGCEMYRGNVGDMSVMVEDGRDDGREDDDGWVISMAGVNVSSKS